MLQKNRQPCHLATLYSLEGRVQVIGTDFSYSKTSLAIFGTGTSVIRRLLSHSVRQCYYLFPRFHRPQLAKTELNSILGHCIHPSSLSQFLMKVQLGICMPFLNMFLSGPQGFHSYSFLFQLSLLLLLFLLVLLRLLGPHTLKYNISHLISLFSE